MKAEPLTLVLPWFGSDSAGGAEAQARSLARALRAAGVNVEVWTTTARDARAPLAPYYPEGDDVVDGIPVRRFRPNPGADRRIIRRLVQDFPRPELDLLQSLTGSDELLAALQRERDRRRWLFFLYAFPTSFWGAQIAGERGYLVACLHDEPYAYHSTTRYLLRTVRKVLANSSGERDLILRLADLDESRVPVVGEGIELHRRGDGARFRSAYRLNGPLLLFAGRRDFTKNWPLLQAYVEEYLARRGRAVTLVTLGPGTPAIAPALRTAIVDLGYVDEQTKHDAYAAADIFCNPSLLESFSIVLMEAWLQGTPALVHGDCAVTVAHCRESRGGLWFRTYREFEACLDRLIGDPPLARQLGAQGQAWVREHCRWEEVARRCIAAVYA